MIAVQLPEIEVFKVGYLSPARSLDMRPSHGCVTVRPGSGGHRARCDQATCRFPSVDILTSCEVSEYSVRFPLYECRATISNIRDNDLTIALRPDVNRMPALQLLHSRIHDRQIMRKIIVAA